MGWRHIKVITSPGAKLLHGCGFVAATVTDDAIPRSGWQRETTWNGADTREEILIKQMER